MHTHCIKNFEDMKRNVVEGIPLDIFKTLHTTGIQSLLFLSYPISNLSYAYVYKPIFLLPLYPPPGEVVTPPSYPTLPSTSIFSLPQITPPPRPSAHGFDFTFLLHKNNKSNLSEELKICLDNNGSGGGGVG